MPRRRRERGADGRWLGGLATDSHHGGIQRSWRPLRPGAPVSKPVHLCRCQGGGKERDLLARRPGRRVTIIGGGVMGLMTACHAAPLAEAVTVLERSWARHAASLPPREPRSLA